MEIVVRVTIVYLFILVGLRLVGKREFGQLSPVELVTLLIIPEIVSQAINLGDNSLVNALVGVATLLSLVFLQSMINHRFPAVEKIISGQPVVLVDKGQLLEETMNKERISVDEIIESAHKSGLERLEQVKWAILSTDGKIAIIPWERTEQKMSQDEQGHDLIS